jgi:hypothetical protein
MYLLYDVIQLRNSSLGNSLLIKRSQWDSVTRDLNSLNVDRLKKASEELAANQITADPLVRRLLKNITAIGVQVPGSFFQKLQLRAELRGLLVREGMPAFCTHQPVSNTAPAVQCIIPVALACPAILSTHLKSTSTVSSTLPATMDGSIPGTQRSLAASDQIMTSPGFQQYQNLYLFCNTSLTMPQKMTFRRGRWWLRPLY